MGVFYWLRVTEEDVEVITWMVFNYVMAEKFELKDNKQLSTVLSNSSSYAKIREDVDKFFIYFY